MISTPTGWIHEHDVRRQVPGKDDDSELVEHCISYLHDHSGSRSGPTVQRSNRTRSKILSAKIAKAASVRSTGAAELRETVQRQGQAIDRLLALINPRSSPVDDERQNQIAREMAGKAEELFPGSDVVPVLAEEVDPDSAAAYRLTLQVRVGEMDPAEAGERLAELHGALADMASDEEFSSIRLIVDPV